MTLATTPNDYSAYHDAAVAAYSWPLGRLQQMPAIASVYFTCGASLGAAVSRFVMV